MGRSPSILLVNAAPGAPSVLTRPDLEPTLARLADLHGVATGYRDQQDRPVLVAAETLLATLAALGVPVGDATARRAALADARLAPLRRLAPPLVSGRRGAALHVDLHLPPRVAVRAVLHTADGRTLPTSVALTVGAPVPVDGRAVGTRRLLLPAGLAVGWHRLEVAGPDRTVTVPVLVAPRRLPDPAGGDRAWGWAVQLYATRSRRSWEIGDLADLAVLADRAGREHGAGLLLVNPLHAVAPLTPMEPSPYCPTSRRFVNPAYIAVPATDAYASADPRTRAAVDALRPPPPGDRIDRDTAWMAKRAALELLWERLPKRFFLDDGNPGLTAFATWCALAERHGPDWRRWPAPLRHPDGPQVAGFRRANADRVGFHAWCQGLADAQLATAQRAALEAGMPVGVVHDLAVGVDPGGADAWALQDLLAAGASVGAPPDGFTRAGQDWRMPPWHPQRLREAGYGPFRDMLRAVLRHAGGVRVDHVLGLFRLWWIPAGGAPADGTYVSYRDDELLGVLTAEAAATRAVVVGEDLGTVAARVAGELARRGVLGSSVLWFERDRDPARTGPAPFTEPGRWRELALASVTTHDLPTAAGFLAGEHVRVRAALGRLDDPSAAAAAAAADRDLLVGWLRWLGLAGPDDDDAGLVLAMHAALARTPSRLVLAALADAVGDLRQPNLPGTRDEYPNWRLPAATPAAAGGSRPLQLEDLLADPRVRRLAAVLRDGLAAGRRNPSPGAEV